MLKGIMDKLFKTNQKPAQSEVHHISTKEVEALVDAKLKEHAASIQSTIATQPIDPKKATEEDFTLSPKQIDYALAIMLKIQNEYELAIDPAHLTIKDLNRLIAYQRYKNKGIMVNLVKKGVLRRK